MEYKKLGLTDFLISRIGFGGLPIGSFYYGKISYKDSIHIVGQALKKSINFFDTADVYGFGRSEKILSKGLGNQREKVIIATKVGVRWNKKRDLSYYDLNSAYIKKAIKKSLANLRIKTIPLYQIHYPDPKTSISETMRALNRLKEERKILNIGCSNFTPELIEKYQKYGRIESLQIGYNILDQKAERYLFPVCKKFNMGIIVYTPLAEGVLTGRYSLDEKFNDRRGQSKYFTKKVLKKITPLMNKMQEIGTYYKTTPAQIALRWILDNPNITGAIVGIKTERELEEAIGATGWSLTKKEREKLKNMGQEILN